FRPGSADLWERLAEQRPVGAISATVEDRSRVLHGQRSGSCGKVLLEEFHRGVSLGQARGWPTSGVVSYSSGFSVRITRLATTSLPFTVAWMPSGCIMPDTPTAPCSRNGMSGSLYLADRSL